MDPQDLYPLTPEEASAQYIFMYYVDTSLAIYDIITWESAIFRRIESVVSTAGQEFADWLEASNPDWAEV